MKYNFRDKLGRFASRKSVRNRAGSKFSQTSFPTIVPGRLYDYLGSTVRAGRLCANGMRHISFHKQLHGFVSDSQLNLIKTPKVREYLANAQMPE